MEGAKSERSGRQAAADYITGVADKCRGGRTWYQLITNSRMERGLRHMSRAAMLGEGRLWAAAENAALYMEKMAGRAARSFPDGPRVYEGMCRAAAETFRGVAYRASAIMGAGR